MPTDQNRTSPTGDRTSPPSDRTPPTSDRQSTKRRRTFYSQESIDAARRNVDEFAWAADRRDEVVAEADAYLESYGGLDGLWRLVTSQKLPRSLSVSFQKEVGSPITGLQLYEEHGGRAWEVDPFDDPWKVTDPTCNLRFPTNDFAAYYESGLDEHHAFDPDLADDSLLVNELYPERGEDWGVDDGTGWVDDEGNVFTFVAYYNHWHVWHRMRAVLESFRDAFLFTGDRRYARAGVVLIDRVADVYPDLDIAVWTEADKMYNSHGNSGQGKIMGSIWEAHQVRPLLTGYDAFFPAIDDDELISFLSAKADAYDLGEKSSADAIRANVEAGIVREILPAVERAQIFGNFGMHQTTLAMAAVVLDDPDYTDAALDFIFRPGGRSRQEDGTFWGEWSVTGGNVHTELVDVIDRDGHPNESPNYNAFLLKGIRNVADILDRADGTSTDAAIGDSDAAATGDSADAAIGDSASSTDLYDHPKVERMHAAAVPLVMLGRFMPHIGDSDNTGDPGINLRPDYLLDAFSRYGDPIYAQTAAFLAGSLDELDRDIFDPEPERPVQQAANVLDREGPFEPSSTNLAGFGFAALRDLPDLDSDDGGRSLADSREAWVYYGRTDSSAGGTWHNHLDALNLGLFGYGLNLAPDLGYPELGSDTPKRTNWSASTVSHNTVLVDAEPQQGQWVGKPCHFAADGGSRGLADGGSRGSAARTGRVDLIDVEAPDVYPQTDAYRRTMALITVDANRSYVVDFFRVAGGDEHHFSFHAAEGAVETAGLDLVPQDGGTYAGADVPKPGYREDTDYNREVGDGFNYFDAVERDTDPGDSFTVDWDVVDTWDVREDDAEGVGLRLTMLGDLDEVALVDGEPPQKAGNPDRLRYLLAKRTGDDLDSVFTSILEPYDGEPAIESVELVSMTTVDSTDPSANSPGRGTESGESAPAGRPANRALKIALDDGRTDYVVYATDRETTFVVDDAIRFRGFFGVYSERDGEPDSAFLADGTLLGSVGGEPLVERECGHLSGTVVDFTRDLVHENELVVAFDDPVDGSTLESLVGEWLYVETDHERNGAYEIQDVRFDSAAPDRVVLDVGDRTTVRGYVDPESPERGYRYIPAEGATFSIPLTTTW